MHKRFVLAWKDAVSSAWVLGIPFLVSALITSLWGACPFDRHGEETVCSPSQKMEGLASSPDLVAMPLRSDLGGATGLHRQ